MILAHEQGISRQAFPLTLRPSHKGTQEKSDGIKSVQDPLTLTPFYQKDAARPLKAINLQYPSASGVVIITKKCQPNFLCRSLEMV